VRRVALARAASRAALRAALLAAVLAGLAACEEPPPEPAAPVEIRATWSLEPPRLRIGDVATLELRVVTPPDHAVVPGPLPEGVEGVWVVDAGTPSVEKAPGRWLHTTRIRIRARAVGSFEWPAGEVRVERPDGAVTAHPLDAIPIEVVSVMPEFPDRTTPFGARLPELGSEGGVWVPAALGAAAALAAVGLVALARRGVRRPGGAAPEAPAPPPGGAPPWRTARAALAEAEAAAARDAWPAAHAASRALRDYAAARFGADARARTSEELAAAKPPFALTSRWPAFVGVLRDLDAVRFRLAGDPADREAASRDVADALARARAFVDDTVPPEERS